MYEFMGPHHTYTISKHWLILLAIGIIWEAVWKLIALWKAAQNRQLVWFIVMGILNTIGILEIIYIFFFQKKPSKQHSTPEE